jgi:hypothetical protein
MTDLALSRWATASQKELETLSTTSRADLFTSRPYHHYYSTTTKIFSRHRNSGISLFLYHRGMSKLMCVSAHLKTETYIGRYTKGRYNTKTALSAADPIIIIQEFPGNLYQCYLPVRTYLQRSEFHPHSRRSLSNLRKFLSFSKFVSLKIH